MDKGAAILDYAGEFGPNSVEKAMRNDGPNLMDNMKPNKVTPYNKTESSLGKDNIETMGGNATPGYTGSDINKDNDETTLA